MGDKFKAEKEVVRDFFPPGVERHGHVLGMDCPCNPYEAHLEHNWTKNRDDEWVGILIRVTINHRKIIPIGKRTENIRMPDFCDDKLPRGSDDLVTTMVKAENRMVQLVKQI